MYPDNNSKIIKQDNYLGGQDFFMMLTKFYGDCPHFCRLGESVHIRYFENLSNNKKFDL